MSKISVLDMDNVSAENFFLKGNNYCNLDIPEYYEFDLLLQDIKKKLNGKKLSDFNDSNIMVENLDDVNYKIMNNKDGKYAWRPFEIIHPALYVQLVKNITNPDNWDLITKRIKKLQNNKNIICCSMPFDEDEKTVKEEIILNWWENFEQASINLSLEYEYIACSDIANCYGSIYTHTISWALHGKNVAKSTIGNYSYIGNRIDKDLQLMHHNQTNGIPQGSVLMDFIAEIVLAYADSELIKELNKIPNVNDYKILRYRDDYKIFAHNDGELNIILKKLSEVLSDLNFKLNNQKTFISNDVISNSIKSERIYTYQNFEFNKLTLGEIKKNKMHLQKYIMLVRDMVIKYPSSGSAVTILKKLYTDIIYNLDEKIFNAEQIISILTDIMVINPKSYSVCIAIISKLLFALNSASRLKILNLIRGKFSKIANNDYLSIWLQRLTVGYDKKIHYDSKICEKIYKNNKIWNSTWTKLPIKEKMIINAQKLREIKPIVDYNFLKENSYNYY